MGCVKEVEAKSGEAAPQPGKVSRLNCGRSYSCEFRHRQLVGMVALIFGAMLVICAAVLASGTYGGASMAFIAGGVAFSSMVVFGVATYFLATSESFNT